MVPMPAGFQATCQPPSPSPSDSQWWAPPASVFLVLLGALGLLAGTGPASAQPIVSDSAGTDAYVLYAPSETALQEARSQLDAAARRFEAAFGVAPPRISVVLADDPETLQTTNLDPYRERGVAFLPFMTRRGLQATSSAQSTANTFLLDGGALVRGDDSGVRVAKAVPIPSASTPLQTGDRIRALQGTPVASFADFRRRYQALAVGDSVRLRVRREGREAPITLAYQKTEPSAQVRRVAGTPGDGPSGPAGAPSPQALLDRSLAHEACHTYAVAYATEWLRQHESTAASEEEEYGHPRLPDWLDEAAATLCEAPSMQNDRLQRLRQNRENWIPLSELLTMQHPLAGIQVATGDPANTGKGAGVEMFRMGSGGDVAERLILFYGQTLSLGQYIRERAGADGLRRLVNALLGGASAAEALQQVDALPDSVDALETAWTEWVRT